MQIGDIVLHHGRRCYLCGVGPMGVTDRTAQLEEITTGERFSAALAELEIDPASPPASAGRILSLAGRSIAPASSSNRPTSSDYPQRRVTNLGRVIHVDRADGQTAAFVFTYAGRQVAELHRPRANTRQASRTLFRWTLTFPNHPEAVLVAPPETPPISQALFFIDGSLTNEDEGAWQE